MGLLPTIIGGRSSQEGTHEFLSFAGWLAVLVGQGEEKRLTPEGVLAAALLQQLLAYTYRSAVRRLSR